MTVEITRDETTEGEDGRKVVFTLEGVDYSIPSKPRINLSLRYLQRLREGKSAEQVNADMLAEMLGDDALNALAGCEYLTAEQLEAITQDVIKTTLGGLEKSVKN